MVKSAEKLMRKKKFIKAEMDRRFTGVKSDELWNDATARLRDMLKQYEGIPKGVHAHTDNYIFPAAAIYLAIKARAGQDDAYSIIEQAAVKRSGDAGRKLAVLMRIPGMRSLFTRIWDPMTRKMFGTDSGFQNVFYPPNPGEYRMDIVSCPYCRYFAELGCPELTKIFCENDDRVYGNLPGIEFVRTGTLGRARNAVTFAQGRCRW